MSVPVTFEPPQLLIKEVARETAELLATGASLYNLSQVCLRFFFFFP